MVFEELKSIISIDVKDVNYTENVCFNVSVLPKYNHGNLTICVSSNNKVLFEVNTTANKIFSKVSGYSINTQKLVVFTNREQPERVLRK